LGSFAVLGASVFVVLRPIRFFGRKLSLEEALSLCWVAWSIYMGVFMIYLGLKLPLGLSRNAHAPAVGVAVCTSLIAVFCLARVPTNWKTAVAKSIFGLLTLILVVVGAISSADRFYVPCRDPKMR
jgi:glucose uptake protein GlcU